MDRRKMAVTNLSYHKPSVGKKTRGLLSYLTYRDSRDDYIPSVRGQERWLDHGLGRSVHTIAQACEAMNSEHVLLFSLVVNPNPDLIALIPPPEREAFVRELTEQTIETYFEARGIDTGVEYSYVVHQRTTDDPQSPGQANPHAHVVLPGTIYNELSGEREPFYFSKNKQVDHIMLLHQTTEHVMVPLLEQVVGLDWEQRFDALTEIRERQADVAFDRPYDTELDHNPVWSGIRQTDEQTSAVGVYGLFPNGHDPEAADDLRFQARLTGLTHEQARLLEPVLRDQLRHDVADWQRWIEQIQAISPEVRAAFCEELRGYQPELTMERVLDDGFDINR